MPTPIVDLSRVNTLAEIVVRAGNAKAPSARRVLQKAYVDIDPLYPDARGVSTLFREKATLDELAREGNFPHPKISFSVLARIIEELGSVGFELVLFVTPAHVLGLPDHHSLAVARSGVIQPALADDAADALMRALMVVDNPYQRTNP